MELSNPELEIIRVNAIEYLNRNRADKALNHDFSLVLQCLLSKAVFGTSGFDVKFTELDDIVEAIGKNDKLKLQKFCFSLSLINDEVGPISFPGEIVRFLSKMQVDKKLSEFGVRVNAPGSGNLSMFLGQILNFFSCESDRIRWKFNDWQDYHLENINQLGLWGDVNSPIFSMVQNGYHQYEILGKVARLVPPAALVERIIDIEYQGCFAPYPGGDSCYDYDSIFFLSAYKNSIDSGLIERCINSVLMKQNVDGGFFENKNVRPLGLLFNETIQFLISHLDLGFSDLTYAVRRSLTLLRPVHAKRGNQFTGLKLIRWDESDLWSTYFRYLTLMRLLYLADIENTDVIKCSFFSTPGLGSDVFLGPV